MNESINTVKSLDELKGQIKIVKSLDELKELNEGDLVLLDFKPAIYVRTDREKIVFLSKRDCGIIDIIAEMYVPEEIMNFYEDGTGPEIDIDDKGKIKYRTLFPPDVEKKHEKMMEAKLPPKVCAEYEKLILNLRW